MAVSDADLAAHIFEELDGAEIGGFTFGVDVQVPNRRAILQIRSHLGSPTIPARIDIAHKMPWLEPEILVPLPMPVHRGYDIELTAIPVMRVEEVLAEKLARYRRHKLARDLYDLAWYSTKAFDEALVRRITVLKVWCDINDDGLGMPPFDPNEILASPLEISKKKRSAILRNQSISIGGLQRSATGFSLFGKSKKLRKPF